MSPVRTLAVTAWALALGCSARRPPAPEPAASTAPASTPATPAPPALPPETNREDIARMLAAHRGQPVVVNVFASWCVPCRTELPDLERLARANPRLFLYGISVDDDPEALRKFLLTVPPSMTVVRRPGGIAPLLPGFQLPDDWNQEMPPGWEKKVPLTLVWGPDGSFATGSLGELSPEALAEIGRIAGSKNK